MDARDARRLPLVRRVPLPLLGRGLRPERRERPARPASFTKVRYAVQACRTSPVTGVSASTWTSTSSDARSHARQGARNVIMSPTRIGA